MSGSEKTIAEAAAEYRTALDAISPLKDAVDAKVNAFFKTVKTFHQENKWYDDPLFGWVEDRYRMGTVSESIDETGIYFSGVGWEDDDFVSYEVLENVGPVLKATYEKVIADRELATAAYNERRKADLLAQLEALQATE
jgi:hypothetical protein